MLPGNLSDPVPLAQAVECIIYDQEVMGSDPGCTIQKSLKWYQLLPYVSRLGSSSKQWLFYKTSHIQLVSLIIVSAFTRGSYGRLTFRLNMISSKNMEIIIIIITIIIIIISSLEPLGSQGEL